MCARNSHYLWSTRPRGLSYDVAFWSDITPFFILCSELNAYQKQIKVTSMTSEMIMMISAYIFTFNSSGFWITSAFSIHLMLFTSELQTPITFLFVNENIKCDDAFS